MASASSVLLIALGPVVARFGIADPIVAFAVSGTGLLIAAVGLLGAIVVAGLALAGGAPLRGDVAWSGALMLAVLVALAGPAVAKRSPTVNEATTDPVDPPVYPGVADLDVPAASEEAAKRWSAYPDLEPWRVEQSPDLVFNRVRQLITGTPGWTIENQDRELGLIHAVATSTLFRFRDDVVVRVRADGAGSRVDMRSRSRVGRGDLGTNAARIRAFLATLKEAR